MSQHLTAVRLRRDVLKNLAKDERWSPGWAYDGRKSMHAPVMFLPQAETSYNVRCTSTACSWRCIWRSDDLLTNLMYRRSANPYVLHRSWQRMRCAGRAPHMQASLLWLY